MKSALLLGLLVVSCSSGAGPTRSNGLELGSLGLGPARVLAYHAPKGSHARLEITTDATLTMGPQGGAIPTLVVAFDVDVEDVTPTGDMKLRITVADTSTRDRAGAQMPAGAAANPLAGAKGVVLAGSLSKSGKLAVDMQGDKLPPAQAGPLADVVAKLDRVAMPLPEVPVGIGAQWKYERLLDQGGLKLTATTYVLVTQLDGDLVGVSSIATLRGADQTVDMSGVPIRVENIIGASESHGTIDLGRLVMAGELGATFNAQMSEQNEKTPMAMTVRTTFTPQ